MRNEEIINFFKNNRHIIPGKSSYGKVDYIGASVYLKNGMYLPCVLFKNFDIIVEEQTKFFIDRNYYDSIEDKVKSSLTKFKFKTQISIHDIDRIEASPFFFSYDNNESLTLYPDTPESALNGFVIEFSDGSLHEFDFMDQYHESFFFNKPSNVEFSQAVKIYSLSHLNGDNQIVSYPDENSPEFSEKENRYWTNYIEKRRNNDDKVNYNMFYFTCYLSEMEKL